MVQGELPTRPAQNFTRPVGLPKIAGGLQPENILNACLVNLDTADGRIAASWTWYDFVRTFHRAPTDAELKKLLKK